MAEEQAIETLKKIALDERKWGWEREQAIDALLLFGEKSLGALAEIADKGIFSWERERALAYIRRIKEGKTFRV